MIFLGRSAIWHELFSNIGKSFERAVVKFINCALKLDLYVFKSIWILPLFFGDLTLLREWVLMPKELLEDLETVTLEGISTD